MKLYHKNHYIKSVPEKYRAIENITDYLKDEFTPRLTQAERMALDLELMKNRTCLFLRKKREDKILAGYISDLQPVAALRVITRNQEWYYTLKMSNGKEIRCTSREYKRAPVKETVKRLY